MKKTLALVLALAFVLLAGCSSPGSTASAEPHSAAGNAQAGKPASDPPRSEETAQPTQREFAVGDTIVVGTNEVTVTGTRTGEGGDYIKPDAGNTYYFVDVAVANKGDAPVSISSMLMFELRDADGRAHNISLSAAVDSNSGMDGTLLPGKVMRGELGYEVPANPVGYRMQINLDVFGGDGVFSVDLDETSATPADASAIVSSKNGSEIAVGETYSGNTFDVVVNEVGTSQGSGFMPPKEGNEYVVVDLTLTNKGTETETVSSVLMFSLRDAAGYSYSLSLGAVTGGTGSLDGEVMPGDTLRGQVGYEVPAGATGLELFVNPGVFGSDDLVVVSLN